MSEPGPRRIRHLLSLAVVQLAVSGAAIALIAGHSERAPTLVTLHLGIVAALVSFAVWLQAAFLQLAPDARVLRALFACLPGALFLALFVVYVMDVVALQHWGHMVSFPLVRQFLGNLGNVVAQVPVRSAVCFGFVALAIAFFRWNAAGLRGELTALFARRTALKLSVGIACVTVLFAWSAGRLLRAPSLWSQEPLFALLDLRLPQSSLPPADAPPEGFADYPRTTLARRPHVVLIVADALRAASMGVYGYERPTTPHLRELVDAGRLARVDLGLASCSQSECGVLSVLGSQDAGNEASRRIKLHDALHAHGYRIHFLLSGAHLAWQGLASFFGPNVDVVRDDPTNDDANLVRALREVPAASADQPAFFYLHLMSSHWFGVQQRDHQRYQPTAKRFDWLYDVQRVFASENEAVGLRQHVVNRYDNSVIQADAIIARLLGVLEAKGYLDDAIVVITSDHGEALGERGEHHYGHGIDLYQELIRIPILFGEFGAGKSAAHGGAPAKADSGSRDLGAADYAVQADIAPTVLDRIGAPIPTSWDGISLVRGERERSFHAAAVPGARSRSGRDERVEALIERSEDGSLHKLLRFLERDGGEFAVVRRELYELRSDPGERRDLADSAPSRLAALEAQLDAHFASALASE